VLALRQVFPAQLAEDPRFRNAVTDVVPAFLEGRGFALLAR